MANSALEKMQDIDKEKLIELLTDELPVLRAKIGLSQEDVSMIIGISRQTYSAIETKKRKMTWSIALSLILYYEQNESTRLMVEGMGVITDELRQILNMNRRE